MTRLSYNTRQKLYPNGYVKQISCSYPVFAVKAFEDNGVTDEQLAQHMERDRKEISMLQKAGWTKEQIEIYIKEKYSKPKDMSNDTRDDSLKRAKEKVFDIAALNDFTHFVTWTLDGEKIDRGNPKEVSKKLKIFLNNMVKRRHAKYLVIPELHKDGKGIHMHGLVSGDFEFIDSGHVDKQGHTVYNMPQWSLGWSTAIELYGNKLHTACYITKYISKDFKKIFGNFYYAGGGVERNVPAEYQNLNYDDINAKEYRDVYGYKYVGFDLQDEQASENSQAILDILRGIK